MAIVRFSLQMGDRLPAHDAIIYSRGAIVNGTQNLTNAVTVHSGHNFLVGHKFYYALTRSNVVKSRVFTVTNTASTEITYSGGAFTWVDGSLLVPLGLDTGAVQQPDGSYSDPLYDGTTVTVYSDPAGDNQYLYGQVPIEPGGDLGFWCATSDLWILARDSRGRIVRVYIVSQTSTGAGAGSSIEVASDTSVPGDNNNPSFLVVRATDVGDKIYIWAKDSSNNYAWEEIVEIA